MSLLPALMVNSYMQADDRRLAELHYKSSLTLQYLDQPEDALKEIKVGCHIMLKPPSASLAGSYEC